MPAIAQRESHAKTGTNRVDFVEFYVGGQSFGLNILKVRQIFQYEPLQVKRLDGARPEVLGSIYFRGKPILLIDLLKALGLTPAQGLKSPRIVLVTEFNETVTSFLIDGVNKIHRESWECFRQLEGLPMAHSTVIGTITVRDTVIQILDLEELLCRITPPVVSVDSSPPVHKMNRKHVKVLYIEDSATIRKFTTDALMRAGFEDLKIFHNGLEASQYLEQVRREVEKGAALKDFVSAIITDIEMPQLDGLTMCFNLKQDAILSKIPVLIYSSLATEQVRIRCEEVGVNKHLSKPKAEEIAQAIDQLLGIV